VLGRAGRITPGSLRDAVSQAVMDVAPGKARKRREHAAKTARVERWGEDSGNGAIAGRELPPASVLAMDHRITWWARQCPRAVALAAWDDCRTVRPGRMVRLRRGPGAGRPTRRPARTARYGRP
jgi:hypothetical protein